jgi:hypothetical protein
MMLTVLEKSYGIRHNGVTVSVRKWDSHKLPVLAVQIEDENRLYKVASFNSIETANWFVDIMQEFFDGIVKKEGK